MVDRDRPAHRLAVGECRSLSLAELCDGGRRQREPRGQVHWLAPDGNLVGRLVYEISEQEAGGLLLGSYWPLGAGESLSLELALSRAAGTRSYVLCPACARSARSLYAPPAAHSFRCRVCCNLVYRQTASGLLERYGREATEPTLGALAALPAGPLPVPRMPRRARLSAELAEELDAAPLLGVQELRLWCLRLRSQGLSLRRIADLLDCGKSSVARYCEAGREGIDRGALVCECLERAARPPQFLHVNDHEAGEGLLLQFRRHAGFDSLREALRRLTPAEREKRVLVRAEDLPQG